MNTPLQAEFIVPRHKVIVASTISRSVLSSSLTLEAKNGEKKSLLLLKILFRTKKRFVVRREDNSNKINFVCLFNSTSAILTKLSFILLMYHLIKLG